jgi:hypothetical protein
MSLLNSKLFLDRVVFFYDKTEIHLTFCNKQYD